MRSQVKLASRWTCRKYTLERYIKIGGTVMERVDVYLGHKLK